MTIYDTREGVRLTLNKERKGHWNLWGPFLSERAWGTVREDYSADGDAWSYFPHDHARSRAYRWSEDGLGGISDLHQYLCFAPALWNGKDPILKERMFGLTGSQGNHGEDVKEYYYYLDNTPTHAYMKFLYKYPQAEYPYAQLIEENGRRSKQEMEYELVDTGVFDESRYFDVVVEYAKLQPEDLLIRISISNRGPDAAPITVLPTLWFRNTWSWGRDDRRPSIALGQTEHSVDKTVRTLVARHWKLGDYILYCSGADELLFTENETNCERLYGAPSTTPYVKDAFHDYVVNGKREAVNPTSTGTKVAARYTRTLNAGETISIDLRLANMIDAHPLEAPFADFDTLLTERREEANEFYNVVLPANLSDDARLVARQAFAGMLWSKQYYHYVVEDWLKGDPSEPPPPPERYKGRNHDWAHLYNRDVISMPDKWEFPWYASWDLGFHCATLAHVDPQFAKEQIILMLREWYMHPNGQIPAYEWNFDDVNPPVLSLAALSVFRIERQSTGVADYDFLERVFQKLLLNFTWWVNRKDALGNDIFEGGFLGGETNQWTPDLIYDNHPVDQPKSAAEGYHLTEDLTDKAIEFIRDANVVAPDKPFFMYFCPGACHAPHHAPKEWIEKYKGKFDMGYDKYRELIFERQKKMGIMPQDATLTPANPYAQEKSADGKPWNPVDVTRPWDSLSADEKKLFARMAEVYAGFLSHADHHIGRLLDYLQESGQLDNTIIVLVSDNGASGEGGPNGSVNENKFFNGIPDSIEENMKYFDVLGSPATYNHYPTGWAWAFNTPFKMWKRYNFEGGTADPMMVSWPKGMKARGEVRHQYNHATDIVPTIYECLGIELPDEVKGYTQKPLEGVSFKYSFDKADAPTEKETGFFVMLGSRAIWHKGWKAVTVHPTIAGWDHYSADRWELYDTTKDVTESHDLAAQHPEKLQELINIWFLEAGKYNGLPLEDRTAVEVLSIERPRLGKPRNQYVYYPDCADVPEAAAVNVRNRSYTIAAEVNVETLEVEGVLFAHGCQFGGHSLYVKDGLLKYAYNFCGIVEQKVESSQKVPTGKHVLSAAFVREGKDMPTHGTLTLYVDNKVVGSAEIKTQPGNFSLVGEGLCVGSDGGEPVAQEYAGDAPFRFVGGTIKQVVVDVSGEPYMNLEHEAQMALMRD